ncbi:hypothetical protein ACFL2K_00825 [Candidatus Margulisiibacteriota bacterium]
MKNNKIPQLSKELKSIALFFLFVFTIIFINGCANSIIEEGLIEEALEYSIKNEVAITAGDTKEVLVNTPSTLQALISEQISSLNYQWQKISGPGDVGFLDNTLLETTAVFSKAGTYNLSIKAENTEILVTDSIQIIVKTSLVADKISAADLIISAGEKAIVEIQDTYQLNASINFEISDDTKIRWEQSSGPDIVGFSDMSILNPFVCFKTVGDYVLQLACTKGEIIKTTEVEIKVIPTNQAPIVEVGEDQTINLDNVCKLSATITDDGYPNNELEIKWQQIEGPGITHFFDYQAEDTLVSFSDPGQYLFAIEVNDGRLRTTKYLVVEVTE